MAGMVTGHRFLHNFRKYKFLLYQLVSRDIKNQVLNNLNYPLKVFHHQLKKGIQNKNGTIGMI